MLNGGYTFKKYMYSVVLPYKDDDLMLNRSSVERSQSLQHVLKLRARSHGSGKPECFFTETLLDRAEETIFE